MKKNIRAALAAALISCAFASSALAFGAIAVDDQQGLSAGEAGYGLGWGSSRAEAEHNAIKECRSAGNDSCNSAVWFEQCGAYVGDRVNYGIGYVSIKRQAERMALDKCPQLQISVTDSL